MSQSHSVPPSSAPSLPKSITAWRIVKHEYLSTAMTGDGAADNGGRWNEPGQRVVYTADSVALAALETLVHLKRMNALLEFTLIPCTFPSALATLFDPATLPLGWTQDQAISRRVGGHWSTKAHTPILRVPSAVVPVGWNYLLNPTHPDFVKIKVGHPVPFVFDRRLK